jgi:hypothetical protein
VSNVAALQACLAAEHAAVYGYGVLAAVIHETAPHSLVDRQATAAFRAHRRQRDDLIGRLTSLKTVPVAASAGYRLPLAVRGVTDAVRFARLIETRCSATYASAVAQSVESVREYVARHLADAAIAAFEWGAHPTAFPGTRRL